MVPSERSPPEALPLTDDSFTQIPVSMRLVFLGYAGAALGAVLLIYAWRVRALAWGLAGAAVLAVCILGLWREIPASRRELGETEAEPPT